MKKYVLNVFKNILRDAAKNPEEAAFIVKFGIGIKMSERRRKIHKGRGEKVPKVVIGSLNSNCNYFCLSCYKRNNKKIVEERENELSAIKWRGILEKAKNMGVLSFVFAGGEPLKRKDVLYEASKIKNIIFPTFISLDAISNDDIKLFDKNRNIVPVLRVGKSYKNESENFVKVVKALSGKGIFYGVIVSINKENLLEATGNEFIESLYKYGCKALLFTEDINKKVIDNKDRELLKKKEKLLRKSYDDVLFFYINENDKRIKKCLGFDEEVFQINSRGNINRCIYLK